MRHRPFPSSQMASVAAFLTFCALVLYGVLTWLDQPTGAFADWMVALFGMWWLLGIVTIPWNLYFSARTVSRQVTLSRERGVAPDARAPVLLRRIERISLVSALAIHGLSAAGFAWMASSGWSQVGWIGCGAALALTVVRPAARLYAYLMTLLDETSRRVRFPEDDVAALKDRVDALFVIVQALKREDPDAWAHHVDARMATLEAGAAALKSDLGQMAEENERAHQSLSREAGRIKERVAEDIQFLGHVREIVQFIKSA